MQALRYFSFAVLSALLVAASALASAPQKSWVGEFILPTRPLKEIKFWSADGKKEVLQPISGEWPFKVRAEEEGRVRVHDGRREGWVAKKDFIIGKDSLGYFEGRIDDNAKDAFALYMLGAIALLQGETDDAVARLTQSIKFAPREIDAYVKRGQAWRLKEESEKAIEDFDTAIRLDPKYGPAYRQRGMLWAARVDKKNEKSADAKKNLANALKDFAEAIQIDPDDADT